MEKFIQNHKKVVILVVSLVLIGFAYFTITSSFKQSTTTQGTIQTSDNDQTGAFAPFSNSLFTISLNTEPVPGIPAGKSLLINAPIGYQSAAVQQLYTLGVDPTNYKIIFNNESPFKPYE